jgi:hypothetical protein
MTQSVPRGGALFEKQEMQTQVLLHRNHLMVCEKTSIAVSLHEMVLLWIRDRGSTWPGACYPTKKSRNEDPSLWTAPCFLFTQSKSTGQLGESLELRLRNGDTSKSLELTWTGLCLVFKPSWLVSVLFLGANVWIAFSCFSGTGFPQKISERTKVYEKRGPQSLHNFAVGREFGA